MTLNEGNYTFIVDINPARDNLDKILARVTRVLPQWDGLLQKQASFVFLSHRNKHICRQKLVHFFG